MQNPSHLANNKLNLRPGRVSILRRIWIPALLTGLLALGDPSPAPAQNVLDSFTPFVHASDLQELVYDGGSYLWAASDGGALRFDLEDRSWTVFPRLLGSGPRGNDLVTIARDADGNIWTGSASRGFTFFDPVTETWDRASDEWPDPRIRVIRTFGPGVYIGTQGGLSLKPTPARTDICADSDPGCIVPSYVINDFAIQGDTLWVGTDEGLGRWNGTSWDSAGALPSGSIGQNTRSLVVFEGELWEANQDRVRRLVGGIWTNQPIPAEKLVVADGSLYALSGNDVYYWNGNSWSNLAVPVPSGEVIRDMVIVNDRVWLATAYGLVLWEGGPQPAVRFLPPTPPLSGVYTGLGADSEGNIYAGTSESDIALAVYDGAAWGRISPSPPEGLSGQWIFSVFSDRDDGLWVGHCCCPNPSDCYSQVSDQGYQNLSEALNVRAFVQDSGGRVWGATRGSGIRVLENIAGSWGLDFELTSQNTGGALLGNNLTSVVTTGDGSYFGHEADGVDYWPHDGDLQNGRDGSNWVHIGVGGFGLLDNTVGAMLRVGSDVWIGTAGGIHRFQGASLQERCPTRRRDLAGDPVRKVNTLVQDRQGGLWIGTDTGILYLPRGGVCDAGGGQFSLFTDQNTPLPNNRVVSSVINPRDGSIWFGTPRGLLRVDPLLFTGSKPPPDKFVIYPNPMNLSPQADASYRRVSFGIEVGGLRVDAVRANESSRPEIFDLTGRKVGDFEFDGTLSGGGWSWDGRNGSGDFVAPGIYIVRSVMNSGEVVVLKTGVIR